MEKVPRSLPPHAGIQAAVAGAITRQTRYEQNLEGKELERDIRHPTDPNPYTKDPKNPYGQVARAGSNIITPPDEVIRPGGALDRIYSPFGGDTGLDEPRAIWDRTTGGYVDGKTGAPLPPPAGRDPSRNPTEAERKAQSPIAGALKAAPKIGRRALIGYRALHEASQGRTQTEQWEYEHPLAPLPEDPEEKHLAEKIHRTYDKKPARAEAKVQKIRKKWDKKVSSHNKRTGKANTRANKLRAKGRL